MTLRPEDPITLNGGRGMELIDKQKQIEWAFETAIELMRLKNNNAIADGLVLAQEEISKLKQERDFYKEDRDRCERLERKAHEKLLQAEQERDARYEFDKQRTIQLENDRDYWKARAEDLPMPASAEGSKPE